MPRSFRGTVNNGEVTSSADNLPYMVISCILINKTASTNTINLSVVGEGSEFWISPKGLVLATAGAANSYYITDVPFLMNPEDQLKVTSTAELSYFITIENIDP